MTRSKTKKSMRTLGLATLAAAALSVTLVSGVAAQDRGDRRGGGDPAERAQRLQERRAQAVERMKEQMQASDEDFAVLGPMIQNVAQLQRETQQGRRGQGNRRGRGGDDGDRGQRGGDGGAGGGPELSAEATAVQTATTTLREVVSGDAATPEQLKSAVDELRADRQAHAAKLAAAREALRSVLVARQEAVLVLAGVLD